jgi:hypothetical protein
MAKITLRKPARIPKNTLQPGKKKNFQIACFIARHEPNAT